VRSFFLLYVFHALRSTPLAFHYTRGFHSFTANAVFLEGAFLFYGHPMVLSKLNLSPAGGSLYFSISFTPRSWHSLRSCPQPVKAQGIFGVRRLDLVEPQNVICLLYVVSPLQGSDIIISWTPGFVSRRKRPRTHPGLALAPLGASYHHYVVLRYVMFVSSPEKHPYRVISVLLHLFFKNTFGSATIPPC
jgi:hypothetical protein